MLRPHIGIAIAATVVTALSTSAAPPPIKTQNVVTGLYLPTFVTHAPGDKCRLFVLEKRGTIKVIDISGAPAVLGTFLDIDALVTPAGTVNGEQGLLGMAFHPDYWNNGYFFVYYTANNGSQVVARYQVDPADPNVALPGSALTVLTMADFASNHNGGWMDFGPDGYLYISTGDGGGGNDPNANGQNKNSKLGKMLRIAPNVEGTVPPYTNPSDNPFFGATDGDDSVWAYGLRNPYRCSFDSLTGDLWIGDVGQDAREEIDWQEAGAVGGRNYGWRCMEALGCTGLSGCTCNAPSLTLPIKEYLQVGGTSGGNCVIGGYVYRGCAIPGLQGFYIHGDYVNNNVWAMKYAPGTGVTEWTVLNSQISPSLQGTTVNSVVAFGEDASGELYVIKHSGTTTGGIFKIVPPGGGVDCGIAGDFNLDGVVDGDDLGAMLGFWGTIGGDLNCDHTTDGDDLGDLLGNWTP